MKNVTEPVISELNFYPIKSFRGFNVGEMRLDPRGPMFDRRWMLVDEAGKFLTMRQLPKLARIGLRFDGDTGLELSSSGTEPIDFGLNEFEGPELEVTVWKDNVPAHEVSGEVSEWLTGILSSKVRLVRMSDRAERGFSEKMPGRTVGFSDGSPLLVIGRESLRDLERRIGTTMSMSRFRPNIVIENIPAYAEDNWSGFTVDGVQMTAIKPCTRCKITNVHPLTGEIGVEPLKTLETYRKQESGKVTFGQYFAHVKEGKLKVGSKVTPS